MWDIRMGQTLVSDFPINFGKNQPDGHHSYKIEKGEHSTSFDKELKNGVLVKRDSVSGDWKVVDKFGYSGETPAEKFETYNDLHDNWGVWKDKGFIFKNNKIDQGEVTPLKDIFDKSHDLGWVGGDVMGAHPHKFNPNENSYTFKSRAKNTSPFKFLLIIFHFLILQ